jgi:hypothetical protein
MAMRIRRLFRGALLVLLALELLYAVPVNVALNTPIVDRWVNRRPERFRIDWAWAVSPVPGFVALGGVVTGGQSRTIQWEASLRAVGATFAVRPLFHRDVRLHEVRAKGVRYAQRPRLPSVEAAAPPADAADWPPIDRANPPPASAIADGPKKPPGRPWTVRAGRIRCGVEEIWIGRYRIVGEAVVDAALDLRVRGPVALPRLEYRLKQGEMRVGALKMFEGLRLDARARLDPFTPRGRKAEDVIRALSGEFELDAKDGSLKFLEVYFRKVEGFSLDGGGPMRLHLVVDEGRLLLGTRLERKHDRIDTTFLDNRITGTGTVEAEVIIEAGIPISRLVLTTPRYEVARAAGGPPFAHGTGFILIAKSANLDLTDPFKDVRLTLDLEKEEIPDLSVYNVFFPKAGRSRILSGVGRMSWHFEGDTTEHSLRGDIRFDMLNLALKFEETTLVGDVIIRARLKQGEPRARTFDISGTTVTLEHRAPPWHGVIRFPRAVLAFTEPMRIDARATLDLQDTGPLVRVFDALKDVPPWIERFMTIDDVRGGTGFTVRPEVVDIHDLVIHGKGLKALAELRLRDAGKEGILYIRIHGLSLGIRLEPGKERDLKLVRPLAWFERERSQRGAQSVGNQ